MGRQRNQRLNFNFNKGWNTEASPMSFPENTAKDLDNVILDTDGSVRRRPGVNFDKQFTYYGDASTTSFATEALAFYEWTNVNGSGFLTFAVTQKGTTLYFHRVSGLDTVSTYVGSVDFSSYSVNAAAAKTSVVSVASGMGYLFVTGLNINPFYVDYNGTSLVTTPIDIKIRDFVGVDDGLETDEKPATLSALHEYNLKNQGWPSYTVRDTNGTQRTPINHYKVQSGVYPANNSQWFTGTTPDGSIFKFSYHNVDEIDWGNTPAPKGRFILNAFTRDRAAVSGVSVPSEAISTRPTSVAFHNGRVFYAGLLSKGYIGDIYYSQQLLDIDRVGRCYQENDPTAEEFNELLATDGGVISIPGAGRIVRLQEGTKGVVVFAANGVWEITGKEGRFSATDFYVRKITDIGCIGGETVINADGNFLYWSDSGIIMLRPDQITGELFPENVSKETIQTGYLLIGGNQRRGARGTYISEEKKAVWLYSTDTSYGGTTNRFKYNGVLVLDTRTGAFYKYSISDVVSGGAPYVAGIIKTTPYITITATENVTVNEAVVTVNGAYVTVPVEELDTTIEISSWKLLTVRSGSSGTNSAFTMSEFNSKSWTDWQLYDGAGADYSSYLETGYDYVGNPMVDKKPTYVHTYYSSRSKTVSGGGYYEVPEIPTYIDYCGDISTLAYTGNSKAIGAIWAGSNPYPVNLEMTTDGTKVYILGVSETGTTSVEVAEYDLSTAYDLSTITASPIGMVDITADVTNAAGAHGIEISDDGRYLYICAFLDPDQIIQYQMTTPYDITTAVKIAEAELPYINSRGPKDIKFTSDGTKLYTVEDEGDFLIRIYDMDIPWDISAIGSLESGYNYLALFTDIQDINLAADGSSFTLLNLDTELAQVDMTTAHDLSTASYVQSYNFNEATSTHGSFMNLAGTYLLLVDEPTGTIYEYSITCV